MKNPLVMCLCNPLQVSNFKEIPLKRSDDFPEPLWYHKNSYTSHIPKSVHFLMPTTYLKGANSILVCMVLCMWITSLFNPSYYRFISVEETNYISNILVFFLCSELECHLRREKVEFMYIFFLAPGSIKDLQF